MRTWTNIFACVLFIAGCTTGLGLPDYSGEPPGTDIVDGGATPDVAGLIEDMREPEETRPGEEVFEVVSDVAADAPLLECDPGEGCFLDKCEDNIQCQSGWCVEHMGEGVCTRNCQEECPDGWSCKQVGGDGPDVVYICVSNYANLCRPCSAAGDCQSAGGAEDVCVDYGEEGSFCGGQCGSGDDCPWGFSCQESYSVDGALLLQCVADAGVCPCTGKSVALGLWTPCESTNDFGACAGKRFCLADGLSECDALTAAPEICNGLDDDCDGDVDEPYDQSVDPPVSICNDDNPCTKDSCAGEAGCNHATLTEGECMDGDSCTVGDHCEAGVCVGTAIQCDDDNPCTDDTCDGLGGCAIADNIATCDDGDACTVADQCDGGNCTGYAVSCDCLEDADCAALEDGDLCNGTLHCDTQAFPYKCEVEPGTTVICPEAEAGSDAICQTAACSPATGACSLVPDHENFPCADDDACTVGDKCLSGVCAPGPQAVCVDGNPCTDDSCDPLTGCAFAANSAPCNDGSACTTSDTCANGVCIPGGTLECEDGNSCTDDSCDPQAGCVHLANQAGCSDANACTSGDHCAGGLCGFSQWVDCDDSNQCTADGCDPQLGCTHDLVAGECSDGDPCTAGDQCVAGLCQGGQTIDCDDGNPCTDDACDGSGQCIHAANAAPCSDGNECTVGDHCDSGACVSSGLLACDDDDVCTTDYCDPAQGCMHNLSQAPCDDGNVCTTGDHCHLGECIPSGQIVCDDMNPCTDNSCSELTGCTYTPNDLECDDGNDCTSGDHCLLGVCTAGEIIDCDDTNECTKDYCDLVLGCTHINIQGICDDGNACTVDSTCNGGVCQGGIEFNCDDSNVCTDDSCNPATGCLFENNQVECDDGNACTQTDLCAQGACVPGGAPDCDDSNVCTDDSCLEQTGCENTPVQNETPCGNQQHCINGQCVDECSTGSQVFNYTGNVQTFVVPDCVDQVTIEVWGAEGGPSESKVGGQGGHSTGTLTVSGGQTLYVYVGGKGGTAPNGTKGWNGGGIGTDHETQRGGGGGGASDVRLVGGNWDSGAGLNSRLIVAGGGGGGWNHPCCHPGVGGHGGGSTGGTAPQGGGAFPGTQSGSGCCGGAGFGMGGGNHSYGGGGGGWWGGGSADGCCAGAGAGGSGYVGGVTNAATTNGGRTGNGQVTIEW